MILGLLKRRRARLAAERQVVAVAEQTVKHLVEAADIAISTARRTLTDRMPTLPLKDQLNDRERVDVAHVLAVARERFGLDGIPPKTAAAVLRGRYELRTGGMDLLTDAYDYLPNTQA